MKTIYTIAAIAMFAVILGIGALSPATAAKTVNPNSSANFGVCHYFEAEFEDDVETTPAQWNVKYVNSNGALNGHVNHNDPIIGGATDPLADPPTITTGDCTDQTLPIPEPDSDE